MIEPPRAYRIVSYLGNGYASRYRAALTRRKSTTTLGLPFFYTTKAGDAATLGYSKGTPLIRPCSRRGSMTSSMACWSFRDRLYGACLSFLRSTLSLNRIGIVTPSLNIPISLRNSFRCL